jgi:LuxR family maltose regulon positive regulatory protein
MIPPLLSTKLNIPRPRHDLVPRPRLVQRLNDGLDRKLTLISAPAGFGKTTLLSEWAAGAERPIAWLSLGKGDNDPARFLAYLIAALQTVQRRLGGSAIAALQSSPSPGLEPLFTDLTNDIAEVQDSLALVLDDIHLITEPHLLDGLAFFVEHLPPPMHLVLAGRADPPWPLARLRARGEMTELRATDLRFTPQEVAAFLNEVMDLSLSAREVAALDARTEGWIAGLQMAALSMRGRDDAAAFVEAFSGSHRFVLDFLIEEVVAQQPPDVREFLLETSILEQMNGSLVEAVTGRGDGAAMLAQLEGANLFLIPLDDERCWYRYHHLFADLLRSRLQARERERVPELYRRASTWCDENGLSGEAIEYAWSAGDTDYAADLIEKYARPTYLRGEVATATGWLEGLSREVLLARPRLCLDWAALLAFGSRPQEEEPFLQAAERLLRSGLVPHPAQARAMLGEIAGLRAFAALDQGHTEEAILLARQALEQLPSEDRYGRGLSALTLAEALRNRGALDEAIPWYDEGISLALAAGHVYYAYAAAHDRSVVLRRQGRLREAAAGLRGLLQDAARAGRDRLPAIGPLHSALGWLLLEGNDLDAAEAHAQVGLRLCQQGGSYTVGPCYVLLAFLAQARGDSTAVEEAFRQVEEVVVAGWGQWPAGGYVGTYRARLWLQQGNLTAARRWVERLASEPSRPPPPSGTRPGVLVARLHLAEGQAAQALHLLGPLLEQVEESQEWGMAIEMLALQAVALKAQGETAQALTALERALALAGPEGYVRTFVDLGAGMCDLLRTAVSRGVGVPYAGRLLAACEEEMADRWPAAMETVTQPAVSLSLVEPLTEREMEVLRYLTTSLRSPEIADQLTVATSTVRSHIKSIYGKLNAHNRMEAVHIAETLGLLDRGNR